MKISTKSSACLIISVVFSLIFSGITKGQAPNNFSYQAVVRNELNQLVNTQTVGLRLSILQNSATGNTVYVETHSPTTNANGLFSVQVGNGTVVSGSIASIDWSQGPYFIKTEVDPLGATNYTIESSSQLQSVPYALYSSSSGSSIAGPIGPQGPQGEIGPTGATGPEGAGSCETLSNGNMLVVYSATNGYGLSQSQSSLNTNYNNLQYTIQSFTGNVLGAVASERQIVVYTSTNAYCFYQTQSSLANNFNTGVWSTTSLSGTVIGAIASKQNVVVYTTTGAYGFSQSQSTLANPPIWSTGSWNVQSISGAFIGAKANGRSIVVYTSSGIYTFFQSQSSSGTPPAENSGNWVIQSLSEPPIDAISNH